MPLNLIYMASLKTNKNKYNPKKYDNEDIFQNIHLLPFSNHCEHSNLGTKKQIAKNTYGNGDGKTRQSTES